MATDRKNPKCFSCLDKTPAKLYVYGGTKWNSEKLDEVLPELLGGECMVTLENGRMGVCRPCLTKIISAHHTITQAKMNIEQCSKPQNKRGKRLSEEQKGPRAKRRSGLSQESLSESNKENITLDSSLDVSINSNVFCESEVSKDAEVPITTSNDPSDTVNITAASCFQSHGLTGSRYVSIIGEEQKPLELEQQSALESAIKYGTIANVVGVSIEYL